jgi:hypothetical protein
MGWGWGEWKMEDRGLKIVGVTLRPGMGFRLFRGTVATAVPVFLQRNRLLYYAPNVSEHIALYRIIVHALLTYDF